ncbi:MAG: hypothetical protein CME65_10295 [Halobacteriovoraceae bacterium]|nr:hypothetical protein [Halobacteriovoraceae bacterium]|tara:strand:- start:6221 stop:7585 length:1365 start_codon:yes stop_codon:yes gene_type:complete
MINLLKDMLLIEEPSVFRLYQELIKIANYFIAPVFTISLILEYFGEMNFASSVKKLFLVIIFMGAFYGVHTKGTNIALESASQTLRKVSPTNLFVKKWLQVKVKTKHQKGWDSLKSILIPNINDLLGTAFYLLAKLFIWLLKLIYSSVYHLTYVFAGVTAILYFLGWTKDALKGTIQASLWCMVMPFVIVAILSLVGNSIEDSALNGDLVIAKIDTILWLFGVTLLLLISPLITYGMIRGDGIHSFGSKMGAMVVSSGIKAMTFYPMLAASFKGVTSGIGKAGANSLFEPPIKDLLKKESGPDKKKMKLIESMGSIKRPFSQGRPLEERLKSVGMTKDEATKLSKVQTSHTKSSNVSNKPKQSTNGSSSSRSKLPPKRSPTLGKLAPTPTDKSHEYVRLKKQNFKFNQKYWDGINPHKAEAIKKKYGIKGTTVNPNKVHRPINRKPITNNKKDR